jgi:ergothioneine biosynthesis protein EgtB
MGLLTRSIAQEESGSLAFRYRQVRQTTLSLCAPLSAEDMQLQPMADASPAKWHLAHTTWFFETFILSGLPDYSVFYPEFTYLFNSYYKQLGGHPLRARRGLMSRPSLDQVLAYREHVDRAIGTLLDHEPERDLLARVELGLHHEQQHQELIVTDVKYALWSQPLRPAYSQARIKLASAFEPLAWVTVDEGIYQIGYSGDRFAFDNELPRHKVYLDPFKLAARLVTNAEYLEFINDRGYSRPELWLSDGWDIVQAEKWQAPLYWEEHFGSWRVFTMAGMQTVDSHQTVCHVSYYEADAFARWAGARLCREQEWEVVAARVPLSGNLLESQQLHPVAAEPGGSGPRQMFGDVWEWTASAYLAYPGFQPAAGALGEYNGKFMCNQFVLRGGSCATPLSHLRASYRNFFPPGARWQFSGIRLAQDGN